MDLQRAHQMAVDTINYYCPEFSFQFDGSVRRFGLCRHLPKKKISISKHLTQLNSEEEFLNVLLHEIAHALAPIYEKHGREWRRIAISIGCTGERLHNAVIAPHKYSGTCPACGRTIKRFRRKVLSCGKCCPGVFNKQFLFQWKAL